MIVEDNPDMRDFLALRVHMTGYLPIVATQGKEGVESALTLYRTALTLEKFGTGWGVLSLHARRQLCLLNSEPSHSSGLLVSGIDEETERS